LSSFDILAVHADDLPENGLDVVVELLVPIELSAVAEVLGAFLEVLLGVFEFGRFSDDGS